ncbi:MAG: zinc ABC transporter substrate-binding protein [Verrucomicrobiae bacterium]|nr:zinc ABC transporter substrate-binding protein [Verrucomicrobiae bacterium]
MKVKILVSTLLVLMLAPFARAELKVIATLPDLGSIAREIGGNRVEVTVLAKPTEDPHFVDAKPSFITKLASADVLIEGGAELEKGWLPPLEQGSRNAKIQRGAPGRIVASEGVKLLGVPTSLTRAEGDIHPFGNPHFMTDPLRAEIVARHIARSFAGIDAPGTAYYDGRLKEFDAKLLAKTKEWTASLGKHQGESIASYHDSWLYFAQRFGLKCDVFMEPKPGIPPSPSHLAEVTQTIKDRKIKAILVEPFQNRKVAQTVAERTGAEVVDVSQFPGGIEGTSGYLDLLDTIVKRVNAALEKPQP